MCARHPAILLSRDRSCRLPVFTLGLSLLTLSFSCPLLTDLRAQENMSKLQDFHDTAYLSSLDLLQKFLAEPKRDVNAVDEVWFYLQFCYSRLSFF